MQLLTFPDQNPDTIIQAAVVEILEAALERAKAGEITSVVVIGLDDRGEQDSLGIMHATDGWVQTMGMLAAAQRSI